MPSGPRTRSREPAAVALAAGASIGVAAEAANVSTRTIDVWLAEPDFAARVRELQDAAVSRAVAILSDRLTKAAEVLADLLDSASETVRLRAAEALIRNAFAAREFHELQRRLEDLERRAAAGVER